MKADAFLYVTAPKALEEGELPVPSSRLTAASVLGRLTGFSGAPRKALILNDFPELSVV